MKWRYKVTDRYVQVGIDDGRISSMKERGEEFGPQYTVLSRLYEKEARLEIVERDGQGTLVEAETGLVVAQDKPGEWAELRPHIGHRLEMGDHCCEELIYVECVDCNLYIYDRAWYE
ncbi:MAG: hypothetical protein J6Z82_00255 [Schwartzia sp.]|nr:hypothetical protein [Schwartzia sp. (in: firmicutes)]